MIVLIINKKETNRKMKKKQKNIKNNKNSIYLEKETS